MLFKCNSFLLNQYGKILKILEIPSLPYHHSINQIHEELTSEQKLRISKYIQFMLNTLYPNEEKFSNDISDIFDELKRKNNLHTYIAVSFLTDQFHVLRNHWKKNTNKNDKFTGTGKGINDLQTNQEGFEPSLGGKFIIINWNTNEIVYELDLDAPAGFFIENNILYIANNRLHYISIINLISRKEIRRIENSSFNCLHSLQRAENESILITSTGIDAIIQINFNGDTINDWYATEHGYNLTPKGEKRFVQRDFHHHHYIYPTLYQTTHINSAIILDSDYFLATLFHQGLLIKINRKNGKSEVLLSGLHCPHGIKRYKSMIKNEIEWMLCNTKQNELLFLNKDFQIIQNMILEDINWLQDATQIQNGNIILTDANHSRIIEIDQNSNDVINEFQYSNDWRIYQISDLTDFQTNFIPRNTKINSTI
ncbi:hypothetical protein I4U23_027395 [Adineta vaga]|nr:hypothetical protein I4U23_027395 [Adineta vaga]